MTSRQPALSQAELERLLAEDAPYGDLTTTTLGIGARRAAIRFAARRPMVVAGIEDAAALLRLAGVEVSLATNSGAKAEAGDVLLTGEGSASSVHIAWKVSQTLTEIWSGVATATRAILEAARAVHPGIVVACTRKNPPGTKALAAAAVQAGGAVMHRLGLSETILVFAEHRAFRRETELAGLAAELKAKVPEKKLVIEVNSVDEGAAAASSGFDVIQAEKFTTESVAELAAILAAMRPRPALAAAGGITLENAAAFARAGADILVTSWPYSAPPADVAVTIEALN